MEKRNRIRTDKRLLIKYGKESADKVGFTGDVSNTGVFIKTNNVFNPGTFLKIELTLPDRNVLKLEGKVMWAKKVPPSLHRFTKKSGMGVLINQPPPEFTAYVATIKK